MINFAQYTSNVHSVGGKTMTETVASMAVARFGNERLYRMHDELRKEALMCSTEAQYAPVREQMDRIRKVIMSRPADR